MPRIIDEPGPEQLTGQRFRFVFAALQVGSLGLSLSLRSSKLPFDPALKPGVIGS
jgi:hypothetical protein